MSDTEPGHNPSQVIVGRPARVTVVEDDGRTFHARLQGGGSARISSSELVVVRPGDAVIVSDVGWHVVPDKIWIDERSVGVVRKLLKDGVLLESSIGLRFLKKTPRKRLGVAV